MNFEKKTIEDVYNTLINKDSEIDLLIADFDDTLFYRKGFDDLMKQGLYEEAYQIPKSPTPYTPELLEHLHQNKIKVYIITKAEDDKWSLINEHGLGDYITDVYNQYNVKQPNGSTRSVGKGEIMFQKILAMNTVPKNVHFIDDIDTNLNNMKFYFDEYLPEVNLTCNLIIM